MRSGKLWVTYITKRVDDWSRIDSYSLVTHGWPRQHCPFWDSFRDPRGV